MDFSSSSSSSSSQYKDRAFHPKTRWDLPIYESTPHYPPPPPMENRVITLNSQEISSSLQETGRLASASSSSNYAFNYTNYSYGGGDDGGGSTAEKGGDDGGRGEAAAAAEREHMFDKVVTPSDVGKLNRLVIPKQHAEKYFPLDSASNEKGLQLNFEDRNGKSWRFRYSYWNSSQSYVMTKGWSRFVKEKKLDAGDIVSFQRGVGEIGKGRFYIDWRRRPDAPTSHHHHFHTPVDTLQFQHGFSLHRPIHPPFLLGPRPPPPLPPPLLHQQHLARDQGQMMSIVPHLNHHRGNIISYNCLTSSPSSGYGANYSVVSPNFYQQGPMIYLRAATPQQQMQMQGGSSRADQAGGAADEPMVFESVPVVHGKAAAAKRLRLFGVNMDCAVSGPQHECNAAMSSPPEANRIPSPPSDDAALQLRLHGGASSSTTDFLDKGKSSMSLDFDL